MDPILIGILLIGIMLVMIAAGVSVGVSMVLVGFGGLWGLVSLPMALGTLMTLPYSISAQYAFVVVPMFVLMGALAAAAGITSELYEASHRMFSRFRGSLYYATILAAGAFGAISGSTVVSAAVFTKIALPEMIRYGYNRSISAGCIAGAGTFAALIPPSIAMAIYGILTGESIGRLLLAGMIPGIVTVVVYMVGLRIGLAIRPHWAPPTAQRYSAKQVLESFRGLWAVIVLAGIVLGGIYSGTIPPSAAGTLGACGALLICVLRRRLSVAGFWDALSKTASITAALFLIIIGGMVFSRLLLATGFVTSLTDIASASLTPLYLLVVIVVMYLVLGCFVDPISMMVMTVPFLYPIVKALGLDPIWFGVIVVKLIEISAITPPVGLNLYAVVSASEGRVKSGELFRGILPFVFLELVVLAILLAFPRLSLWLPNTMIN